MKNKKAIALIMTAVFTISALAGCGAKTGTGNTDQNGAGQNSGSQEVTGEDGAAEDSGQSNKEAAQEAKASGSVEFWNDKLLNTEQAELDKMFGSIESLSGIRVTPVAYPDTAAYQTAMQQSIRGEDAPGLFTWWSGPQMETLASNGLLEDLTDLWPEYVESNGVAADIAESFTVDGKIYAVPYSIIYNTIIYNKNIFEQYSLAVPTTFDEFLTVCQTLKDNGITPIALKNDSWAGFIWFQAMLGAFDPQLYQDICDGTKSYTDPDVVKVMTIWKEMFDKGYFSLPMTIQDMDKSLASGTVAMELEPNYEAGTLVKEYGMVAGEDIGTFVVPSMNGSKSVIFFEVTPLCVARSSADKEAAKEVLKSWFKKEHQSIVTEVTNNVNTSEVQTENACVNEMIAYSSDTENYQMMLRFYENTPEEVRNVALDELMKFQLGNAGVDEVLKNIQAKAEEVFAR